jgi:hypothetical protein
MRKLMMRVIPGRVTIPGLMFAVALCALIIGCILEMRRIKRAQAFFGQMAAIYAQREKLERDLIPFLLDQALREKRMAERERESIERSNAGRHWGDRQDTLLSSRIRLLELSMASGREYLLRVRQARIKAERFAILKQTYAEAANCLWLPFAPSPLVVRHPENGVAARSGSRQWPADEADAAEDILKGIDVTEKPAKPDAGETPRRD